MTTVLAVAVVLAAGYWAGRIRPGQRLDEWADRQVGGPHGPAWWAAQIIMAVEIAYLSAAHPRRTRANVRASRQAEPRVPAPALDPDWAARRTAGTGTTSGKDVL